MTPGPTQTGGNPAWDAAQLAAALFAVDPRLGGICLRARHGAARASWLEGLATLFPERAPARRAPPSIDDGRLFGSIDLAATLRRGRPVMEAGLLEQADGGLIMFPMSERMGGATAAKIAAVMDEGVVRVERDGSSWSASARFGVIALDEGLDDDERTPPALLDRLAFHIDLEGVHHRDATPTPYGAADIARARAALASVEDDPALVQTLVLVAASLGVSSLRAAATAVRTARAACALRGATRMTAEDMASAARAVLAPRATRLPPDDEHTSAPEEDLPPDERSGDASADTADGHEEEAVPDELRECVLDAARAAIPQRLLETICGGAAMRTGGEGTGKSGPARLNARHGRPMGARPGRLRDGRLSVVGTLCAAAPWQALRKRDAGDRAIVIRPADFRIQRLSQRRETVAIFVVDASGSAALQRLAEVKGAIELFLAECYVRRDHVALVAFRGRSAEILLHPTRSLARARRELTGLPGGGGTPLSCGLETAVSLADSVRRKGQSPLLVLMTDGRANVTRDGSSGRSRAMADALEAARAIAVSGFAALAIDTSSALQQNADAPTRRIAQAMNARYIGLPFADAVQVSRAVSVASARPVG